MPITINHVISLSPALEILVLSKFDDLNQKLDALEAALATEKTEDEAKTAEIANLRTQLGGSLTAEQATTLEAHIQTLLDNAPNTVTPDVPPAPAPTPEPAPTPAPDPNTPPA